MAQTIPGGAFLLPDRKTWVNSQGERIAAPKQSELYIRPETVEPETAGDVTPGADELDFDPETGLPRTSEDEFGDEPEMVSGARKPRKTTKKS